MVIAFFRLRPSSSRHIMSKMFLTSSVFWNEKLKPCLNEYLEAAGCFYNI